jgi:hypothetical protein
VRCILQIGCYLLSGHDKLAEAEAMYRQLSKCSEVLHSIVLRSFQYRFVRFDTVDDWLSRLDPASIVDRLLTVGTISSFVVGPIQLMPGMYPVPKRSLRNLIHIPGTLLCRCSQAAANFGAKAYEASTIIGIEWDARALANYKANVLLLIAASIP